MRCCFGYSFNKSDNGGFYSEDICKVQRDCPLNRLPADVIEKRNKGEHENVLTKPKISLYFHKTIMYRRLQFMLPSFLITFREAIEAALIVATILGILAKTGPKKKKKTLSVFHSTLS